MSQIFEYVQTISYAMYIYILSCVMATGIISIIYNVNPFNSKETKNIINVGSCLYFKEGEDEDEDEDEGECEDEDEDEDEDEGECEDEDEDEDEGECECEDEDEDEEDSVIKQTDSNMKESATENDIISSREEIIEEELDIIMIKKYLLKANVLASKTILTDYDLKNYKLITDYMIPRLDNIINLNKPVTIDSIYNPVPDVYEARLWSILVINITSDDNNSQ